MRLAGLNWKWHLCNSSLSVKLQQSSEICRIQQSLSIQFCFLTHLLYEWRYRNSCPIFITCPRISGWISWYKMSWKSYLKNTVFPSHAANVSNCFNVSFEIRPEESCQFFISNAFPAHFPKAPISTPNVSGPTIHWPDHLTVNHSPAALTFLAIPPDPSHYTIIAPPAFVPNPPWPLSAFILFSWQKLQPWWNTIILGFSPYPKETNPIQRK